MNVIGYIRVSTEEQKKEGWSLDAQTEKIKMYCALHDLELKEIISDEGITGTSIKKRPGMLRLLDMTANGKKAKVDGIVTVKLDRLFRNAAEAITISEKWRDRGIEMHFISEGIQTNSAAGKVYFNMLAVFAQFFRDVISENTVAALAERRRQGLRNGGKVPFGYRDEGGNLYPDAAEIEVIREIETMRRENRSIRAICAILDAAGYKPRDGGRWSPASVHAILKRKDVKP